MATTCEISGNSDMYGLGIWIGFYVQWLSSPISAWIAREETSGLRTANAFFVSATFLGLIIETALNHLDVAEIYIILLLGFGTQYYMLVATLWRIVTNYNAKWDPTRFSKMPTTSKMFSFFYSLLLIAQIVFQLWFWIHKIPVTGNECQRFGFALFKVGLTSSGFWIANIILMVALLVITAVSFALHLQQLWQKDEFPLLRNPKPLTADEIQKKKDRNGNISGIRKRVFCIIDTAFRIASIAVVILATELTISWNRIQGVNDIKSVGQLIPMAISVGGFGHLLLATSRVKWWAKADETVQRQPDTAFGPTNVKREDEERQSTNKSPFSVSLSEIFETGEHDMTCHVCSVEK